MVNIAQFRENMKVAQQLSSATSQFSGGTLQTGIDPALSAVGSAKHRSRRHEVAAASHIASSHSHSFCDAKSSPS